MIDPRTFEKCVGCKNENTQVESLVECPDGEKRYICSCHFCGGRYFLPNDEDVKFYEEKEYPYIKLTDWLAKLMNRYV